VDDQASGRDAVSAPDAVEKAPAAGARPLSSSLAYRLRGRAAGAHFLEYFHDQYTGMSISPTLYLVEYALPPDASPLAATLPLDCPGLLFCHCLGEPRPQTLLAYWATREHYESGGKVFEQWAGGLAEPPLRRAFVQRLRFASKPWWKRRGWYALALGSVLTALSAVDAVLTHYGALTAEPTLSLAVSPTAQPLVENHQGEVTLSVVNHTAVAHRDAEILPAEITGPSRQVAWRTAETRIPEIVSEKQLDLKFTGRISRPGSYQMEFAVKACAGYLRPCRTLVAPVRAQLQVWSRHPQVELTAFQDRGAIGEFQCKLLVSEAAAHGVDCRMEVQGVPALRYENLSFAPLSETPSWMTTGYQKGSPDAPAEISVLTWSSTPIGAFQQIAFDVALSGMPAEGWQALVRQQRVQFNCTESASRKEEAP
jgi:hypothetical protein